jgi:hypothetical protein
LVAFASKHGRRPSEVYDDYLEHPQDYRLIFAWDAYEAEEERKAYDEARH